MKTLSTICMAATLVVLAACSHSDGGAKIQSYDEQAPYAHERTVGSENQSTKADHMYNSRQSK